MYACVTIIYQHSVIPAIVFQLHISIIEIYICGVSHKHKFLDKMNILCKAINFAKKMHPEMYQFEYAFLRVKH